MNKTIRIAPDAAQQYRALDASMQLELREHTAHIAEDPLAILRRAFTGTDAARLLYEYASYYAHGVTVHLTFELNGHDLALIDIRSFSDERDNQT